MNKQLTVETTFLIPKTSYRVKGCSTSSLTSTTTRRCCRVLLLFDPLHDTKPLLALIEDGVNSLQPCVTQDIELGVPPGLNSTVLHAVSDLCEAQVFLLDLELVISYRKGDSGQPAHRGTNREHPALILVIELRTWNRVVDLLAQIIADQGKCGTGICDGSIGTAVDDLAVDGGRGRGELPEAFCGVDTHVVGLLDAAAVEDFLVDVTECVEGLALVGILLIAPGAEVAGEKFLVFLDVVLGYLWIDGSVYDIARVAVCLLRRNGKSYHVFDRCSDSLRLDSVDFAESEAEKTITCAPSKLSGELGSELDGLVLDTKTTKRDVVCTNDA